MAYLSTENVKQIREALKANFPKFKFSVKCMSNHLGIEVTMKSGPVRFADKEHVDINQYYLDRYENEDVLRKMYDVINNGSDKKNYDRSDMQSDYFDIGFHVRLYQGTWSKPYVLTEK